jgi:hypothetical protein
MSAEGTCTGRAVDAISDAITAGEDVPGWLGSVLAHAAARRGSSTALTARRPGPREAELVIRLVCGTAGWAGEDLSLYGQPGSGSGADSQPGHAPERDARRTRGPELTHTGRQPLGSRTRTRRNS